MNQGRSNVALNRPATQSSVSEWSAGTTPETDAAFGNNGDTQSDTTFHTEIERLPWWEVDLETVCLIDEIAIVNREIAPSRFCNFTILCSLDHRTWHVAYVKCDARIFTEFTVPLRIPVRTRYVRIRSDAENYLHLREVQIFGVPEESAPVPVPPALPARARGWTASPKLVFSVLYNESVEFLPRMIDNYLAFTDEGTAFVINLAPHFSIADADLPADARVIYLRATAPRRALGATLLLGHLDSYRYAREILGPFDYFAPIASNCLFLRPFSLARAETRLAAGEGTEWYARPATLHGAGNDLSVTHDDSWYYFGKVNEQKHFLRFLHETLDISSLVPMQIEGLMAPGAQWSALADRSEAILACEAALGDDNWFPMEEILPGSFFARHFDKRYTSLCHVFWHPFRTTVTMEQVVQPQLYFPPHISIVKWFERDLGRPETAAMVSERARALVALVSEAVSAGEDESLPALLRRLADSVEALDVQEQALRK